MTAVITRAFAVSNYWECALWSTIGLVFLGFFIAKRHTDLLIGFITFILFGLSDYIEAHTGAWWTPWWLLMLKGGCILVFVILLYRHARRSKAA